MMIKPVKRIALVGGTHGNELTGVFLIRKFQQFPNLTQRDGIETITLLANPEAIAAGRRYIDTDLNRTFNPQDLENTQLINHEQSLAKAIAQKIHQEEIDCIIDLHSTTANMGLTVILHNSHPYLLRLAAYLSQIDPLIRVLQFSSIPDQPHLRSLVELGITIEVGAIANNVLDAKLFQQTENLIHTILSYFEAEKKGESSKVPQSFYSYRVTKKIDYPRNQNGEIEAMVHHRLQFQDYQPLHPDSPIFYTFNGDEITYKGKKVVYPVFVNEAAYYEKGIAMYFTQKQENVLE